MEGVFVEHFHFSFEILSVKSGGLGTRHEQEVGVATEGQN